MAKTSLAGRTAVITGGGGGIGRAIAHSLASRGCNLALADINEAGLAETEASLVGKTRRISTHRLDVADRDAIAAFPETVLAKHDAVDILVNNAGVALGGTFEQVELSDFEWVMEINFWGVVRMTRAFLPHLHTRPDARIVNLSSLFGLIALPGQTAYSSSKFAVRGFSESLRKELEGTTVRMTVVHPGGVATSIAANARIPSIATAQEAAEGRAQFQKHLKLPASRAGEIIVRAVETGRDRVLVGNDAKLAALIERIAPVSYWKVIKRSTQ